MKKIEDLKVGDAVWTHNPVNFARRPPVEGTVTKIGTKLITVGRNQYRKDTLRINDDWGHTCIIIDLDEWERGKKIASVRNDLSRYHFSQASNDQILEVAKILGITIPEGV